MSTIELKNVWKIYGRDILAVKNADFYCENGEFAAILGPSGCGKSSILRMIAGLEDISKGEILFGGDVVNGLSPSERNVALAFESYALYSPLTVYENIRFPLRARGASKSEIEQKVNQISEALELNEILQRKPSQLSGGQQQRVSLARALVRNPNVFLLDEPLSHLDSRVRATIRARIRRIHDELETTTIYVTHDQEEAVALADRIIVMNLGTIQQVGTVDELWNHPANLFVAGFIGEPSMGLIKGKTESEQRIAISTANGSVIWPVSRPMPATVAGKDVVVGIRPEKLKVSDKETKQGLKVDLEVVEFMGDHQILGLRWKDIALKAMVSREVSYNKNEVVWVWGKPEDILVFDQESGNILV